MPSNGSRHTDDALGSAGDRRDDRRGDREEGDGRSGRDAHSREPEASGESGSGERFGPERSAGVAPKIRDLRGSRGDAGGLPNIYEMNIGPEAPNEVDPAESSRVAKERDELLDALRRMQADFENYKKRVERQSAELRDRANERIVERMLPALDAFGLAREHIGDSEVTPEVRALLQAASLFEDVLEKEGLERIDTEGVAFDPSSHDAVEHVSADASGSHGVEGSQGVEAGRAVGYDDDDDEVADAEIVEEEPAGAAGAAGAAAAAGAAGGPTVVTVLRPGYIWKGRVIRPAMVRVQG